jgi:hypothetical protein
MEIVSWMKRGAHEGKERQSRRRSGRECMGYLASWVSRRLDFDQASVGRIMRAPMWSLGYYSKKIIKFESFRRDSLFLSISSPVPSFNNSTSRPCPRV